LGNRNIDKEIDSTVVGLNNVNQYNPIKEIEKNNLKVVKMNIGNDQFLSNYYFPSYWEAIGVITPEDKDLNFAVENQEISNSLYTIK
jgi:hypothetical protein